MTKKVKLLLKEFVTHDVSKLIVEKPKGYIFTPGQATELAIDKPKWRKEKRPFTFTNLPQDLVLEFTPKSYPVKVYKNHRGVTEEISRLKPGDVLLLDEPWGTIRYKGPGVFVAGGAGITPFISIFRDLRARNKLKGNKLLFSNKKKEDIISEQELRKMFSPKDLILTLTREKHMGYENGRVDERFIRKHVKNFKQYFYLCGPRQMVNELREILSKLGVKEELIVYEK